MSKSSAGGISQGVFLICLGMLFYLNWWWPGIIIAVWALLATRQILTNRKKEFLVTTLLLATLFVVVYFGWSWNMAIPVLFAIAGIFLIFREFLSGRDD